MISKAQGTPRYFNQPLNGQRDGQKKKPNFRTGNASPRYFDRPLKSDDDQRGGQKKPNFRPGAGAPRYFDRPQKFDRPQFDRQQKFDRPQFDNDGDQAADQRADPNKPRFRDRKHKEKMPQKDLAKLKKARIIVRNVPFGIDEQQLSSEFGRFGDIHEVIIPTNEDGKQKGFAFVNYKKTMFAIKAVKEMNGKQLSSDRFTRTIAVDFAMAKQKYINHMYSLKKIDLLNEEEAAAANPASNDQADSSDESISDDDESADELNEKDDEPEQQEQPNESTAEEKKKLKRKNKFIDDEEASSQPTKKPKKQSNDIEEGRTVFIKNLSFDTRQEDLADLMGEFGELEYCIICVDKVSEHSKGTAFAKFKNKADADKCIEMATNKDENEESFYLDGRILDVQLAISKDQLGVKKLESEKLRDKRNLYLSKEGLIYPDSPAAAGVSAEDLKKRMTLSQNKKKQLEDLHYFVSKNRLCFHNLPASYRDNDLRKLCVGVLKGDKDYQILYCKIMMNKDKATNKLSTSKGFGFVSFSTHKHALRVLRALNNNPTVFTSERRPIVEFTVENMNAVKKNGQFIIKESLELGLDGEHVTHPWAGYQARPFGGQEKIINPLTDKRMKDKRKKLQEKIKEQKVERREEKFNQFKKESIKQKKQRIAEHKPLKKKQKKSKPSEQDPHTDQEMKFLSKIDRTKEENSTPKRKRPKLVKKKKWDS